MPACSLQAQVHPNPPKLPNNEPNLSVCSPLHLSLVVLSHTYTHTPCHKHTHKHMCKQTYICPHTHKHKDVPVHILYMQTYRPTYSHTQSPTYYTYMTHIHTSTCRYTPTREEAHTYTVEFIDASLAL